MSNVFVSVSGQISTDLRLKIDHCLMLTQNTIMNRIEQDIIYRISKYMGTNVFYKHFFMDDVLQTSCILIIDELHRQERIYGI